MSLKPKSTVSDKEYNEVVSHKPNDTELYYNHGIAYYKKREYDKAIADYNEDVKCEPDHAKAH